MGHVWKIDEKILKNTEEEVDAEAVINRFAAELLMPEKIFKDAFIMQCIENGVTGQALEEKVFIC